MNVCLLVFNTIHTTFLGACSSSREGNIKFVPPAEKLDVRLWAIPCMAVHETTKTCCCMHTILSLWVPIIVTIMWPFRYHQRGRNLVLFETRGTMKYDRDVTGYNASDPIDRTTRVGKRNWKSEFFYDYEFNYKQQWNHDTLRYDTTRNSESIQNIHHKNHFMASL